MQCCYLQHILLPIIITIGLGKRSFKLPKYIQHRDYTDNRDYCKQTNKMHKNKSIPKQANKMQQRKPVSRYDNYFLVQLNVHVVTATAADMVL